MQGNQYAVERSGIGDSSEQFLEQPIVGGIFDFSARHGEGGEDGYRLDTGCGQDLEKTVDLGIGAAESVDQIAAGPVVPCLEIGHGGEARNERIGFLFELGNSDPHNVLTWSCIGRWFTPVPQPD